ncbi:MAG: hypothetical protein Q8873_01825 [Bacillota bacterium]|nr:hypothetical protein [Bacillota bacterium]
MAVKQVSVFVENKCGRAYSIIETLGENGINISALSIAETEDYGVMRLIVDDHKKAIDVLSETGVIVKCTDVLAVPIEDKPGGLAKMLDIIQRGGLSVIYMYAFTQKNNDDALLVVKTKDIAKTAQVLEENGVKPIEPNEIFG